MNNPGFITAGSSASPIPSRQRTSGGGTEDRWYCIRAAHSPTSSTVKSPSEFLQFFASWATSPHDNLITKGSLPVFQTFSQYVRRLSVKVSVNVRGEFHGLDLLSSSRSRVAASCGMEAALLSRVGGLPTQPVLFPAELLLLPASLWEAVGKHWADNQLSDRFPPRIWPPRSSTFRTRRNSPASHATGRNGLLHSVDTRQASRHWAFCCGTRGVAFHAKARSMPDKPAEGSHVARWSSHSVWKTPPRSKRR